MLSGNSAILAADLQHGVEAHYYSTQFWNSNTENDTGNNPSPLSVEMAGAPIGYDMFDGQTFGGAYSGASTNGLTQLGTKQPDQLGFLNNLDVNWNNGSPVTGIGSINWSAVCTGKIHNDNPALFTFITNSDDDSWVYVDGALVASDPNQHTARDVPGTPVYLNAGDHSVVYFYSTGFSGDLARLRYSTPAVNGGAAQPVSTFNTASALYWNSFVSEKPGAVDNAPQPVVDPANGINTVVGQAGQSPAVVLSFVNSLTSAAPGNNSAVSFMLERSDVTGGAFTPEWLAVGTGGLGYDPSAAITTGNGAHVTAFDATALPGHSYLYRVRAVNFDGIGDPSAVSTLISIPAASATFGTNTAGAAISGAEAHYYNDQFWGSPLSRASNTISKNAITQFGLGAYIDGQASNDAVQGSVSISGNLSPTVGEVPPLDRIHNASFSAVFTGQIHITQTGTYSFSTNTDSDGYLWISDGTQQQLVSQDGGSHGPRNASDTPTNIAPIVLTAGNNYDFVLAMAHNNNSWSTNMFWRTPADSPGALLNPVPGGDPGIDNLPGIFSISSPTVAPTGLAVTNTANNNRVSLTWTDNNKSEVRYVIERATDASFTTNITETQVGLNSSSYTDFTPPGATFYYRVRAENFDYQSPWAGPVQAVVNTGNAVAMPTSSGLNTLQEGSQIKLFWTNNNSPTGSEAGTLIQRQVDGGGFSNYFITQRNLSTFTDQAVVPGHTYAYKVATMATAENRPVVNSTTGVIDITTTSIPISTFSGSSTVSFIDASGNVDRTTGFIAGDTFHLLSVASNSATLPSITSDGRLRLTDGGPTEGRTAWLRAGTGFLGGSNSYGGKWDSEFDWTFGASNTVGPTAGDALTFILQSRSPNIQNGFAGPFGFDATNTIGIYFNLWQNVSETGLLLKGNRVQPTFLNTTSFGNQFHSTDVFHVALSYDGSGNLNYTITDKTQPTIVFSTSFQIDPTQVLLDQNTYAGFTAGNGGATFVADVLNWWWSPTGQTAPAVIAGTSGNDFVYLKASAPGSPTINYWTSPTPFTGTPFTAPTGSYSAGTSSGLRIHGLGGADNVTVDESNGRVFAADSRLDSLSSANVAGSMTVNVIGTVGDDILNLDAPNAQLLFSSGTTADTLALADVIQVNYTDNGGNDTLSVTGAIPLTLNMGNGNDILNVAAGSNATVNFGASNGDLTINGAGNTLLVVGTGNPNVAFIQTPPIVSTPTGAIAGTAFNDANGDGKRGTHDAGLAGCILYIDSNHNGKLDAGEPITVSGPDGSYVFAGLADGSYRVREVPAAGFRATSPAAGYKDVKILNGKPLAGVDFGRTPLGLITGVVYRDKNANANARPDPGEKGLAGWVVYLDRNNDGKLDAGDLSTTTDVNGRYAFAVAAGKYTVREVVKRGFKRTTPTTDAFSVLLTSGQQTAGKLFGNQQVG